MDLMAKAYVIVDVEVTDPESYADYKELSSVAADKYGATWLVRGGAVEVLEGDWEPHRLVVLEFEDQEAARRWYGSPGYTEARGIRQRSARASLGGVGGGWTPSRGPPHAPAPGREEAGAGGGGGGG